jgi:hypothetical protein
MRLATSSILLLAFSTTACLRSTAFQCETSAECGTGASCEAVGYCSVSDSSCDSGMRFTDSAGTYANQCVGDPNGSDGGVTDGMSDAGSDGPLPAGCPTGYNTITGGQGTHLYLLIPTTDDWITQRDFCATTSSSAYLAVPDEATELTALATLGATTMLWVGITDQTTEGAYLTVKGTAATFLPWATGQPDNNAMGLGEDCVAATATTFTDERCAQTNLRAVCECEP